MKIKKSTKKILLILGIIVFVLGATALYYLLFIREDQEEKWYDSNWSYRRSIYIKEIPKEFQNTQQDILLEIDTKTLITEEKLTNNCSDLRFLDEDNDTSLRYWVEGGCNTDETQVWVNLDLPRSSEKIIYMYYGNALAPDGQETWDGEFITMSTKNCPNNWTYRNEFSEKFLLSDSSFGSNGGNNSHNHNLFIDLDTKCKNSVFVSSSTEASNCDTNKDNILNLRTTSVNNIPQYENINFCSSKNGYLSKSSIILSDQETFKNWQHVSILDNKYPRGKSENDFDITEKHVHQITCVNKELLTKDGSKQYLTLNDFTKTELREAEPSYYTFNFISNPSGGTIPSQSILMVTEIPPLGWEKYSQADGKLLKGSENTFKEEGGINAHFHIFEDLNVTINTTSEAKLSDLTIQEVCVDNLLNTQQIETTGARNLPPYISVLLAKKKNSLETGIKTETEDEITRDSLLKTKVSSQQNSKKILSKQKDLGEVLGATAPSAPTDLLTEGETNPTDITDHTPEFSAIYNDADTEDTSSYYEIEVNTESDFTGTVMWDSGKTGMTTTNEGDRSPDISYDGDTLSTEITYYWRIKFWDSDDNESPWSSTANFKIAGIPTATTLYTCGLADPTYVVSPVTFSAVYSDPNSDSSSNYEIEVNTSSEFTGTVMWDTGKTATTITSGNRSSEFEYSGTSLDHDSTVYYVRMRFWDTDDNVSDWTTGQFTDILKGFRFEGLQMNGIQLN